MLSAVLGSAGSHRASSSKCANTAASAYFVGGMNHSYTDPGSLLAQAGVDINRMDEAIKVIVKQFRAHGRRDGHGSDELEKSR